MGYLHIDNLYKAQDILFFKECFALEKVHGTSAHVSWKEGELHFFAGGCKHDRFVALFDHDVLASRFVELGHDEVVVFGEAYGGKLQGMRESYGDELRFIAFDVKVGKAWLSVPDMVQVVYGLDLEPVPYALVPTTLEALDAERDRRSEVAVRRGCGDKKREGIVLRPPIELTKKNGARVIAKYKREDFAETKTPRPVDAAKLAVLTEAATIAQEWVTPMRLTHVLDKLPLAAEDSPVGMESMGDIIKAMLADIEREAEGEVMLSKDARKAIGRRAVGMFKARLTERLAKAGQ